MWYKPNCHLPPRDIFDGRLISPLLDDAEYSWVSERWNIRTMVQLLQKHDLGTSSISPITVVSSFVPSFESKCPGWVGGNRKSKVALAKIMLTIVCNRRTRSEINTSLTWSPSSAIERRDDRSSFAFKALATVHRWFVRWASCARKFSTSSRSISELDTGTNLTFYESS